MELDILPTSCLLSVLKELPKFARVPTDDAAGLFITTQRICAYVTKLLSGRGCR